MRYRSHRYVLCPVEFGLQARYPGPSEPSFNRQSCIKSAAYYFKDAASDKKDIGVVVPFVGPGLQSDLGCLPGQAEAGGL
jgi:hypothetical protein